MIRNRKNSLITPELFKLTHANLADLLIIDHYPVGYSTVFITSDGRYLIDDPKITEQELNLMLNVLEKLIFKEPLIYLNEENIEEKFIKYGIKDRKLMYLLKREIFGFGALEPIIKDPKIEDIQIPAPHVPARVIHSDYDRLITNLSFSEKEMDVYVERLAYKSEKSISTYRPLLSARGSETTRITVTYKREIGHKGSSITIRKFPENPWSITRLLVNNTIDPWIAALAMMLIENRKAIMVLGLMGSGKTSLINALANLIHERATIITVEDTPELRLAHPYWIPLVTRESLTIDEKGSIDMFTLVKHALRMSGDYLIVGEVRGEEGRIWAQAIMTGHGGITSFHAENHITAISRLVVEPINVDPSTLAALHSLVQLRKFPLEKDGKRIFVRRLAVLYDFEISLGGKKARFYRVARYIPPADDYTKIGNEDLLKLPSVKLIIEERSIDEKKFLKDFDLRLRFFTKLKQKSREDITLLDYRIVTQLIWKFYSNPAQFDLDEVKVEEGLTEPIREETYELELK